jgi:tetratricopeptide (TPR) repeat protein
MKRLLIALCLLCALPAARSQGLEDQYVKIYTEIQQADSLAAQGQDGQAGVLYQEALAGLNRLRTSYPTWNAQVVSFRINYVNGKLAGLRRQAAPAKVNAEAQPSEPVDWTKRSQALAEQVRALEAEKAELSAKLKEALSIQPAAGDPAEVKKARDSAQALSKENDALKAALEQARAQAESAANSGAKDKSKKEVSSLENRLAAANTKIDDLKKQLADLRAEARTSGKKNLAAEAESLRARLKVYEARAVPFTAEELALVSADSPSVSPVESSSPGGLARAGAIKPARRPHHELPPGAGPLMAEAERDFASGRAEAALAKFLQVLSQGEDNLTVLCNVAACQIQLNRKEDAEKNVARALALDPADEPALELMGTLRYQENKFDEAFAALSRATELDPRDALAQNMLGATLAQKGDRSAAETAFRRAIEIRPDYGLPHYNLAVIYANQSPPFLHLARFHYLKALALGHPADEKLAKLVAP